ncbi:MAG: hypothetical protein ABEJ70_00330 [Halobacteriaceae archaeon]
MRTVRDADGHTYLLLKRSADACLVRDPESGERRHLPTDSVTVAGESPLDVAATAVPEATRRLVRAAHSDRGLGLLVDLRDRGPLPVTAMLADYDCCESDLHGLLAEFRAAGLVAEATVGGERGYRLTDDARVAVDALTR